MMAVTWMSEKLISVRPDQAVQQAIQLMEQHKVRQLPVIENDRLVGIVSDRDIKRAGPSRLTFLAVDQLLGFLDSIAVADIMTGQPQAVHMHNTIQEVAQAMLEHKVNGLPVVDDQGKVRGMITRTDLLRAFAKMTGAAKGGMQLAVALPDRPGALRETTDLIRARGGRIENIIMSDDPVLDDPKIEGWNWVHIRATGLDRRAVEYLYEDLSRVGRVLYIHGLPEDRKDRFVFTNEPPERETPPDHPPQ